NQNLNEQRYDRIRLYGSHPYYHSIRGKIGSYRFLFRLIAVHHNSARPRLEQSRQTNPYWPISSSALHRDNSEHTFYPEWVSSCSDRFSNRNHNLWYYRLDPYHC